MLRMLKKPIALRMAVAGIAILAGACVLFFLARRFAASPVLVTLLSLPLLAGAGALIYFFVLQFDRLSFQLGMRYYRQERYAEAARNFRAAADGHVGAARMLGEMYFFGTGIDADLNLAIDMFGRAFDTMYFVCGIVPARGVRRFLEQQNRKESREWFAEVMALLKQASQNGNVAAMDTLSRIYAVDWLPESSRWKSIHYHQMAIAGDPEQRARRQGSVFRRRGVGDKRADGA